MSWPERTSRCATCGAMGEALVGEDFAQRFVVWVRSRGWFVDGCAGVNVSSRLVDAEWFSTQHEAENEIRAAFKNEGRTPDDDEYTIQSLTGGDTEVTP